MNIITWLSLDKFSALALTDIFMVSDVLGLQEGQ
jgi:hypothetical protein